MNEEEFIEIITELEEASIRIEEQVEAVVNVVRRTETRLVQLAKHLGADHIGAPSWREGGDQ